MCSDHLCMYTSDYKNNRSQPLFLYYIKSFELAYYLEEINKENKKTCKLG